MEKIESFNISKKTLIVMDNFSKLLSSEDAKSRKIRITPNWLEVKIAGMVGFYDCSKEDNSGFQEFVIAKNETSLSDNLEEFLSNGEIPIGIHDKLWNCLKLYLYSLSFQDVSFS